MGTGTTRYEIRKAEANAKFGRSNPRAQPSGALQCLRWYLPSPIQAARNDLPPANVGAITAEGVQLKSGEVHAKQDCAAPGARAGSRSGVRRLSALAACRFILRRQPSRQRRPIAGPVVPELAAARHRHVL